MFHNFFFPGDRLGARSCDNKSCAIIFVNNINTVEFLHKLFSKLSAPQIDAGEPGAIVAVVAYSLHCFNFFDFRFSFFVFFKKKFKRFY